MHCVQIWNTCVIVFRASTLLVCVCVPGEGAGAWAGSPRAEASPRWKLGPSVRCPPSSSIPPHLWRPLRRGVAGDAPDYGQCGTLRGLPSHSACILCHVYCLILRYAWLLGQQCARKWDARHTMQCIICNGYYAWLDLHNICWSNNHTNLAKHESCPEYYWKFEM